MKRKMILPITLLLAFTLVAAASASGTIMADVTVRSTTPPAVENNTRLTAAASYLSTGPCTPTYTAYIKWNLADVTTKADPLSTLTLRASLLTSGSNGKVALYKVSDVDWTEATISAANPPAVGDLIAAVPVPPAVPQSVEFTGDALASYIDQQSDFVGGTDNTKGPNMMSLAVQIIDCTAPTSVGFYSSTGATPPVLNVLPPTAITLSTFHSADPAVNWPLIVGLGTLAAVVIGGLAVSRRRVAAR